jgi:hypothetical protein
MSLTSCSKPAVMIAVCLTFVIDVFSAGPRPVEVWCRGDDGLTLRLRDALERAFTATPEFTLSHGNQPRTLVVTIPTHVRWKQFGKRLHVYYSVEYASTDGHAVETRTGSCWDDALAKCASQIVKYAAVVLSKIN